MRDRLIELLKKADETVCGFDIYGDFGRLADELLANGVIVPPCKVGDTVYEVDFNFDTPAFSVVQSVVEGFAIMTSHNIHRMEGVGESFHLTKEEAEMEREKYDR